MGRSAAGVKGIRLKKEDEVIGMDIVQKPIRQLVEKDRKLKIKQYLLVVTENGYGKRTALKEYSLQRRGGVGVKTAKVNLKIGNIVASKVLTEEEDLIAVSRQAQMIRMKIASISKLSRATQGVRIMKLGEGDKVVSVVCV